MKLKHIAAFGFRVLGALLIARSLWTIVLLADSNMSRELGAKVLMMAIVLGLLGGYLIYFSRFVAAIFCKGLDDDDVA